MNIKQIVSEMFRYIRGNYQLPVVEKQVYSTAETVIGVWTDGKPLYRKIIDIGQLQSVGGTTKEIAHNIQNIDMVISCKAILKGTDGFFLSSEFCGWVGTLNVISVACTSTNICIATYDDRSAYSGYAEIQYTKTTDTPQSTKVPLEPLTEYSTDEKLIGYWIDGKPLYRKTFLSNATLIPMQWFHTDIPIGDSEQIVNASAYATNGSVVCAINASNDNPTFHLNYCGMQGVNVDIYAFTLEYTKTTDTP